METKQSFSDILRNETKLVLVDFWAEWCGPCLAMAPILQDFATAMQDKVRVLKVNVDKNPTTAQQYTIRSIPTLVLFKGGNVVWRTEGTMPLHMLIKTVEKYL